MNRLYVNGLIWHSTSEKTIAEAVAECIEDGIWDIDQSAECELCNEIDQTIEYNKNYKVEPRFNEIVILVDGKAWEYCDIRTLEEDLENARNLNVRSFVTWRYC